MAAPPTAAHEPLPGLRGCFVVGIARSGTSLLKALFDGHPELYVPPAESLAVKWCADSDPVASFWRQTKYAERFPPGTDEHERLERGLRARIPGPCDPATAVSGFLATMSALVPPPSGATVWVEKTPRHLRVVPHLLEAFGEQTRVVGLVRDPRGVLASQVRRWGRIRTVADARAFARRWAAADALTRHFEAAHPAFLAIRYEDLVADPRPVMQRVARHLGIAFTEGLVQPTRGGRSWSGNSSDGRPHEGVSTRSIDKWAEEIAPEMLDELDRLLAPRMAARGYAVRAPSASRPSWRRLLLGLAARREIAASRGRWDGAATSDD